MNKLLLVPDLHGNIKRLEALQAHLKDNIDNYDKVIFLGDYADSFTATDDEILATVQGVIDIKKLYPYQVVLLMGNHDYQYYSLNQTCSGFRATMHYQLHELYKQNIGLFDVVYYLKSWGREYLFSHAGVTEPWCRNAGLRTENLYKLYNWINNMLHSPKSNFLWMISRYSGGIGRSSCPLWARPQEYLEEDMLNAIQYVGHTHQAEPYKIGLGQPNKYVVIVDTEKEYVLDVETDNLTELYDESGHTSTDVRAKA